MSSFTSLVWAFHGPQNVFFLFQGWLMYKSVNIVYSQQRAHLIFTRSKQFFNSILNCRERFSASRTEVSISLRKLSHELFSTFQLVDFMSFAPSIQKKHPTFYTYQRDAGRSIFMFSASRIVFFLVQGI